MIKGASGDTATSREIPVRLKEKFNRSRLFKTFQKNNIGLVLLGHLLLTALFTFPLIFNFTSNLPGDLLEDRDQNIWNLWWVRESILHFRNPFQTDFIYFPDGVSLYFHTLHPINGLISAPIQLLFGMVVSYNFIVFFSFVMGGLGAYLLLYYICGNKTAAFAASLIFVYSPYHIGTLKGIMQLISLEWLPFYILFLLKTVNENFNTKKNIALGALMLALTALTDWYYTLFLLGFTALYLGWLVLIKILAQIRTASWPAWLAVKAVPGWKGLLRAGGLLLVFGIAIMPVLIPMLIELKNTTYYLPDPQDTLKFSADLAAIFVPPRSSMVLGWLGSSFKATYDSGTLAAQVYLGYTGLFLALVGLLRYRRTRFWGGVALLFTILSLGPALKINGPTPGWPMPYSIIENLPIIKITRSPDRFIVITMLCVAVCASCGLTFLINRFSKTRPKLAGWKWVLPALAGLLITLEFLQVPYPLHNFTVSPFFETLGKDQADYSLVELPRQGGFWTGAPRMAEQVIHHKRIFDGYISREYPHPFQQESPGFQALTLLKPEADITSSLSWKDSFSYYKVRYIILRLPLNAKEASGTDLAAYRQAIARLVPGTPVYKDNLIEAYAVPDLSQVQHQPFMEIGDNWYDPEPTASNQPDVPVTYHRWSQGNANLNLVWEGPGSNNTTLSITMGLIDGEKPARLELDGKVIWTGKINTASQEINIPLTLTPGKHRLDVKVDGQAVSPRSLGMGNDPRPLLYYLTTVKFK